MHWMTYSQQKQYQETCQKHETAAFRAVGNVFTERFSPHGDHHLPVHGTTAFALTLFSVCCVRVGFG